MADKVLVETFLRLVDGDSTREAAARVEGVSHDDVARWRSGKFKRLTDRKKIVLQAFTDQNREKLRGLVRGAKARWGVDQVREFVTPIIAAVFDTSRKHGMDAQFMVRGILDTFLDQSMEFDWPDRAYLYELYGRNERNELAIEDIFSREPEVLKAVRATTPEPLPLPQNAAEEPRRTTDRKIEEAEDVLAENRERGQAGEDSPDQAAGTDPHT